MYNPKERESARRYAAELAALYHSQTDEERLVDASYTYHTVTLVCHLWDFELGEVMREGHIVRSLPPVLAST
jgi:hypothetical protein